MAYDGLSDTTDERRAQAIEAQASDMDRVAATLEATQPAAALALRTQAATMRQQSGAFRRITGLPPAGAWSLYTKIGVGVGIAALAAGGYRLWRSRKN